MKEENLKNYELWRKEISARRYWLLWHNKNFREELEKIIQETDIRLRGTTPEWRSLQPLPDGNMVGKDHPKWQEFYEKYGIGEFWKCGEVIYRFGERPLGIEVINNNGAVEYVRLIIWPSEINKKRISGSWDYIEHSIKRYFSTKKDPPWSLKIKNFWRDAYWYNLLFKDTHWNERDEKITNLFVNDHLYKNHRLRWYNKFRQIANEGSIIKEIVKRTKKSDPLIFDQLFIEHLINREKGGAKEPLLNAIDPERKIAKSTNYDTLNKLLYFFGIYRIANTKVDWGENFPYFKVSMVKIPEEERDFRKRGDFFVRYDFLEREKNRFLVTDEDEIEFNKKINIRKDFEKEEESFLLEEKGWTDCAFIVNEGIRKMRNRIDSMI